MSIEVVARGRGLCAAAFDPATGILYVGSRDGRVYTEDAGTLVPFAELPGGLSGLAVDPSGALFAASAAHGVIRVVEGGEQLGADDGHEVLVSEYEGRALRGPHSLVFDRGGAAYFSDPGPAGASSLSHRVGSVLAVVADGAADAPGGGSGGGGGGAPPGRLLRPLVDGLASPAGIALDPCPGGDEGGASSTSSSTAAPAAVLYVAERAANRVLRLHQRPAGVWHAVVFHQFAGRTGPTSLVVDVRRGGLLYVARPELPELAPGGAGCIAVLAPTGAVLRELDVPGADVSGLALAPAGDALVYTCSHTGALYKVAL